MYIEFFNILSNGPTTSSITLTFSMVLIIGILFYFKYRKKNLLVIKIMPVLFVVFIISFIIVKYNSEGEYRKLRDVLINKEHTVIEGKVSNFTPMDLENNIPESFNVNGVMFSFIKNSSSSAFNQSQAQGSPIKDGLDVRIFYYQDKILGLWIKE